MILRALCDYAEREHLSDDPVLEPRLVDFIVRIDRQGRFKGLLPTAGEDGRAKKFPGPVAPKGKTSAPKAGALLENSTYVLGIPKQPVNPGKTPDTKRARVCAEAFAAEARRVAAAGGDDALRAVVAFLDAREENRAAIFAQRPEAEWNGSEWLGFSLEDDSGSLIYERPGVQAALRNLAASDEVGAVSGTCLVTGEKRPLARLHAQIKHVPGGQSSGTALVSFNADAFTSYGLDRGENAPISERAARQYGAALNHLLERTPSRYYRSGVGLGADAVVVFWTRKRDSTADFLASLFDPSSDEVAVTVEAPWKGLEPGDLDAGAFYAMTLGGNASRLVVRDWLETITGTVKQNVRRYFDDLRIGEQPQAPRPLRQMLQSLHSKGGIEASPDLAARLFRAAFSGAQFPRDLLGLALRRLRLPPGNFERQFLQDRCSLIKAVLTRQFRNAGRKELTVSLDESSKEIPYLLGRLFAVLERLQIAAIGADLNASIRDRFFGSASATPAIVFPRLLKLSVHHAAKSEAGWLEKLKGQIVDALPSQRFPSTLSLDDQGLFAVGYYHQRERFFRPAAQ